MSKQKWTPGPWACATIETNGTVSLSVIVQQARPTAVALLTLPADRWRYGWRITPKEGVLLFDGKPFWRSTDITARSLILAALMALGEIKPEDVQ